MALLVWLPLNGNLNNQGLSNITITNNGATVNNNGKIGKCYLFGTTASYIELPKESMNSFTTEASVCFWINILSWNTSYATFFQAGLSSTPWTHYIFGFLRNNANSTCCFTISSSSSSTRAAYTTSTLELNTWYHIALCYKTGHCLIYINGQLYLDYSTSVVPAFSSITNIVIGKGTNKSSYLTNCLMNDIRIYDHALSLKEVHEIAKGLVLHYPLHSNNISLSTNLITGFVNGGLTTISGNNIIISGNNSDTYFKIKTSKTLILNKQYKLSCIGTGFSNDSYYNFPIGGLTNTSPGLLKIKNGYCELIFIANDVIVNNGTTIMLDDAGGRSASAGTITNIVLLEYENVIYDYSGYCNHGSITGTLTINTSTPRYTASTVFNGTNSFIEAEPLPVETKTISLWLYTTWATVSSGYKLAVHDKQSGLAIGWFSGGLLVYAGTSNGSGCLIPSNSQYKANQWNHIVVISTGTTSRDVYINGVKVTASGSNYWGGDMTKLFIGARHLNGTYNSYFDGKLSDFRAYVTALSEDDVKELYNTSALIDNKGNINCFQTIESNYETNILDLAQQSLTKKTWGDGLFNDSSQSKAVVTLTDTGLRVYREPNNTSTSSGWGEGKQSNWGGFVLRNTDNVFGLLDGHTYLILVDVKGKSDTAMVDNAWRHHVGWNYTNTGIAPAPTNIRMLNPVNATFNSDNWVLVSYKFTISDTVYKVATSTYLYHTQGETYLAYYQFKLGWTYSTTGAVGTDVYFNNLRMFDITYNTPEELNVNKQGIIEAFSFTENGDNAFIDRYSGSNSNQLIEI